MTRFRTLLSGVSLAMLCGAAPALAQDFPPTLIGTWVMRANNSQFIAVNVNNQGTTGTCPRITGTLGPNNTAGDPVVGYYCPATGLVSFLRTSANTGATFQVFTGQLTELSTTLEEQLMGTFLSFAGGNNNGAFSFTAVNG